MKMTKDKSDKIIRALRKHYPDVKPDLKYRSLYQLAVAVVLSAQTTDRQVNGVTGALFKKYPDFASLGLARLADVESIIRSTGFYHVKAKNIIGLAQTVTAEHDGRLPSTREELVRLPGIGRKSANVILSMGFDTPALAVDTHIIRIAGRLAYTGSRDPLEVERALTSLIPERLWKLSHLLLIRHGRTLCTARKPLCGECPIRALCVSADKIR
ncbi:MAG TPA: endonuclease III [Spirochaetota bacterium]|nr:endonuclease III [Spirochaetota bacterium]HPN11690.1 endonuclease III [Spirochaetota bacterium]HQL81106.1 endonuclease III [Spirochaetota bacterium]